MARPVALDLFCGAGGLTAGLQEAGFDVAAGVDSWDAAVRTYQLNFGHPIVLADIRSLSVDDLLARIGRDRSIDLVAGGPPCQGFSVQRIGADRDLRNELILEFVRFVLGIRPRVFLMENVPGLVGKRGSGVASDLERRLAAGGYEVRSAMVNAADFGVPQLRRRVLYYGWPIGARPISLPKPTHSPAIYISVWDAISDLPTPDLDPKAQSSDPLHRRSRMSELNMQRLRLIPPGGGFEDLPMELRVKAHRVGAARIGHRNVYGRLDPSRPAGTITARFDSFTRGKFAHPLEDRNITLREGARLQSFPDNFRFSGTREEITALIGNAIPPRLARAIGEALAGQLGARDVLQTDLVPDQTRMFPALAGL